jgi:hypothetical protein
MKNSILKNLSAQTLILIAFSFTGCTLFENADDVSFTTTLDKTFNVAEESETESKTFVSEIVLNATADAQVEKYKNKIKGFTVNKITYRITNLSGNASTFTNGKLSFSDENATTAEVIANISSIDLVEANNNGTEFELAVDEGGIIKIQNFLKADKSVKIYLEGTLSPTPVYFDLEVNIDVKVEANVL